MKGSNLKGSVANVNVEPMLFPVVASTHWDGKVLWYVRDVPRKINVNGRMKPKPGFADWEYTDRAEQAMKLSRYWWRRFRSDSNYCGRCAHWQQKS